MGLTISEFWKDRLAAPARAAGEAVTGWDHVTDDLPTFLEAPLGPAPGFGDADPLKSSVILVSAPGAVGKSTLARQIAFETGAMLVDLGGAEPVGGNTIVGGLAKTRLHEPFLEGRASLIVDGLDEARMIATQGHFEAFLKDVKGLADPRRKPLVLLGRTGGIQESWMILDDLGIKAAVLEIGYYDPERASEFAKIQAQHFREESHRRSPDGAAIDLLLDRFKRQAGEERGVFAGYSPVLIAVAKSVVGPGSLGAQNTQRLISRISQGAEPVTLASITQSILEREQQKLKSGDLEDPGLVGKLYSPEEQLGRLAARLYTGAPLPSLPSMSDSDLETYSSKLDTWVPEHPFLHGNGREASSAVFGGLVASYALRNDAIADEALLTKILGGKINPFLARFYVEGLDVQRDEPPKIPAGHVGVLYASVRASLSMGETASLRIEGEIDEADNPEGAAEVEIGGARSDGSDREPLCFPVDADGHFRLGSHVENVDLTAPYAGVTLGPGSEAVLVAPVSIDAGVVYVDAGRIVAENSAGHPNESDADCATVWLGSEDLKVLREISRPLCRKGTKLGFSGPWAQHFPWRHYRVAREKNPDPGIASAERALFRILRLCRSRQSGLMGAPRAAIDDLRRTRGTGRAVRDQLLREEVLTEREDLYVLDLELLASKAGLTFQLLRSRKSAPKTIDFLERALAEDR